ncbi:uncharacterized protein LOC143234361 isoform X2 [Tachypleus tridentatus]|uniref:uncharacterized protein LOC143234361 isoform X2 n=1 Tax=Tachypleus tridentatus TaxID=6853 RepID=UPI003FD5AC02
MTERRNTDSREVTLSYHITYNEKKIVLPVDDLGLLPSKISDNLNLDVNATNLSAHVYMEDWQDWVDVQWSDIPKPRAKLLVSLVSNVGASDGEIAVVNPPNPEEPSSKQSASSPGPSTEKIQSISSCILAFKPWLVPFKLENLSSLPRSTALLLS